MGSRRVRLRPHLFSWDGTRDHHGHQLGCTRCPLPWRHEVHQVDELPPEVVAEMAAAAARRIGETT